MNISSNIKVTGRRGNRQDKGTILVETVQQFTLLNRINLEELTKLKEMFYSLVSRTNKEQRRKMSVALARNPYAPRSILIFLALESIDVASPILLFSQALTEADIRSIIGKSEMGHKRVIARRDGVDNDTIHTLLDHDDENQTLGQILQQNRSIRAKLALVQEERSRSLNPVPAALSATLDTLETGRQVPNQQDTKDLSQSLLDLANVGGKIRPDPQITSFQQRLKHNTENLAENLIYSARSGNHREIGEYISIASNLPAKVTLQYIKQEDVGTFACLLYALDISRATAARVMLLVFPKLGRDGNLIKSVMDAYDRIELSTVLNYFRSVDSRFEVHKHKAEKAERASNLNRLLQHRRNSILDRAASEQDAAARNVSLSA
ncbi:MAG: hypothetical protein AAF478_05135 [Pseudomonadota bacterium]